MKGQARSTPFLVQDDGVSSTGGTPAALQQMADFRISAHCFQQQHAASGRAY
jgi:hypothetical protein